MPVTSGRKPRCVGAIATYLNAGMWGSRFVGDCEISTNGERVWLKGRRVPAWVSLMRVVCFVAFIPVGFYAGWILGETLVGHWGYPPYYYLASALLTFLLVVLGMWGAGIWTNSMSSYEVVSWPASKGRPLPQGTGRSATQGDTVWAVMNTLVSVNGLTQVNIPVGPGGKPRRLVLKARDTEANTLMMVLSGAYYGEVSRDLSDTSGQADPWSWSRN